MLTPSQTLALDLSYHTAIMANAGSGKTYVLVERYLKILEQNPEMHPRNIVAITFTDSAARDLKKKITERIKERISSGNDGVAQKRLREIRQQLNSSEISTIHAFCTNLLRAYPEEAGVDATFTVVTNPEDEILRNDCVRSVFFQSISEEYHHDDGSNSSPLLSLFRLFGRKRLDELMRSLLKSRFKVKITTDNLYSSPDAFILTTWSSKMEAFLVEQLPTKEEVVIFMDFFNGPKLNKKQLEASESLQQYILTQSKLEDLFAYKVLVDKFFTQKNEIRKQVIPFESLLDKYSSLSEKTIRLRREYEPMLDAYLASIRNPLAQQQYLIYCRSILNLYERVLEEYSNQKSNYGLLDYDDLIERALRLVQNVDVREELTKRYKHILIDEYQDTDAAQYEIAKALTGSLESTNTLTIVGDPKQAIYSFRNADLELYFQTLKEISKFASGGESPIVLAESFRMLSIPLAFINIVTTGLFEDAVSQTPQPGLALLVEGRGSTRTGTVEIIYKRFENNLSEKLSGEVEDIQATDDQVDSAEAELIALKIKEIIRDNSGKYVVEDRTEEHPEHNNLRYGDIAILLRKRKKQPELETAFRAHGIPFTTYAGQGYYERSEVTDITNFLTFLVNPDDDIALAGLLRSPYFAFSDVDLYKIAPERGSVTNLWRRLALHISSKDELHFDRAINILSKNLQLVGRISTELLLQNIIAESGILGILESMPGAEQRSANLEKYTQLAISFGKEGFTGTFDFVERINLLMEKDEMEAQAEVRKDTNAVHIMTIHNSKGLEFPVVVLPFLHSKVTQKDSRRVWSVIDKEYGLGIELPEADHSQPIVEYIKIQEQEKNIAEEKRIFYVAMTRARDHLILSASPKNKITEASCLSWVLNSLGEDNLDD